LKNSLAHGDGRRAACNADRVAAVTRILALIGRPEADPAAARALLLDAA
jgi:hypothetical protein